MQRAFLNQLQSDEKLSNDGSCQNQITSSLDSSSNSGIVLLMDETVKIFDHKVSPNTYKVITYTSLINNRLTYNNLFLLSL
jgi:hypothetical protein